MTTMTDTRPEVDYDENTPSGYVYDAFRHEDGSITYIVLDEDGEHANPRQDDGNLCVFVQENDRFLQPDNPEDVDARLKEARDRFDRFGRRGTTYRGWGKGRRTHDREDMVQRYIAIFRPDILHYEDWCSIGRDGYGWGYLPKSVWDEHMLPTLADDATDEQKQAWLDYTPSITPAEAFKSELDLYEQWCCNGEVYGGIHVSVGKPIVEYGEHGAYVSGYDTDEDSCWGFLGYDDHKEIAEQFTDSPITEVLH